jgi:hypothetical protein
LGDLDAELKQRRALHRKGKAKGSIGVRQPVERDIGRKVRQIHAGADCTDFVAMIEVTVVQI